MDITRRRFPRILAEEISRALSLIRGLGAEHALEFLARYRRNRAKRFVAWGVLTVGATVNDLEFIPNEICSQIEEIDRVFQKMHHYGNGGAADYVAKDVLAAMNRVHGLKSTKTSKNNEKICEYLRRRDYARSDNKEALIADAMEHQGVSKSTVYRAIKTGGLGRKKSTVK